MNNEITIGSSVLSDRCSVNLGLPVTHLVLSGYGYGKMRSGSGILGRTNVTRRVPARGVDV